MIYRLFSSSCLRATLALCAAVCPLVTWASPTTPFQLEAGDINFDTTGRIVTANHGATVTTSDSRLTADTLTYNTSRSEINARGHVTLTDTTSQTLTLDTLLVSADLSHGTADALRLSVPELGQVATAQDAILSGTTTGRTITMKDVTYSPCKTCEGERKPWSIHADKVVYNQSASTLTYKNAVMDVYGAPVMVFPWFKHTIGPKRPTDGLLPPMIGRSTAMGEEVTLSGYHFSPRENADYTLRNRLMSERGDQISLERRQMGLATQSELRASYLNDRATSKVRSSAAFDGQYDFSATRRVGINAEVASDDTYLQQFEHRIDPYLPSTAYAEDAGDQHYAALSVTHFQDLNTTHSPANTAQILPHLELEKWWDVAGGQVTARGDMVNLNRGTGVQSRRIVGETDFDRPWLLADGSKLTFGAQARADVYNIDGHTAGNNSAITRLLPQTTLDWEKPYISPNGTHTIAPKAMLAWSPRGGNANGKVPNEDSVAYELDTANLFEPSRFAGLDRIETGPRFIYGLDNRWGSADHTAWRLFVGQSLRRFTDTSLPASGGASTNASDWVGKIEANPYDWLTFDSAFRLDNATFTARRMDSGMRIGALKGTYAQFSHTYLDNGAQEVDGKLHIPFNDRWAFRADMRNDLANSKLLQAQGVLAWTRDCYRLELVARRRGYANGDLQPSTDYMLNLQLLTLGNTD